MHIDYVSVDESDQMTIGNTFIAHLLAYDLTAHMWHI